METLNSIINWILGILTGGVITIILVTLIQMMNDAENRETHVKKIKNAIIFLIFAFAIFHIKDIVFHYFGNPVFQTY